MGRFRLVGLVATLTLATLGVAASPPAGAAPTGASAKQKLSRKVMVSGASLASGQSLGSGESITSPGGQYRLTMQSDGNAVVYTTAGRALWDTHTQGNAGARAVMQQDGNFVVYSASNRALWNSGTAGQTNAHLSMQDDGNLVVYASSGQFAWASGSVNSTLAAGESLSAGGWLRSSNNAYRLVGQGDGNVVLYRNADNRVLWNSQTNGNDGARAVMQDDGNWVVYSASGRALWDSATASRPGAHLSVQDDGNLVIYTADKRAVWASNTATASVSAVAEQAAREAEARLGQVYTNENPNAGWWSGFCETFSEVAYGHRFRFGSAIEQYRARSAAGQIRTGAPPRGALVFYGGANGYGHVAISVGNGQVISTVGYSSDRYPISRNAYGYFAQYLGWALPY